MHPPLGTTTAVFSARNTPDGVFIGCNFMYSIQVPITRDFFCILEDLELLFNWKKQGKYPKIQSCSGSIFFNDFDKNNIKKKLCA